VSVFAAAPPAGLLVTIDGPNGSGKTSVAEALADELRMAGQAVHATRQPSPTPLGDRVRAAERTMRHRALACLVAGDRHHQAETELIPRLAAGEIIVCDRYLESSLVLQRLDGVDVDYILAINDGVPRPGQRIRLLADPRTLADRLAQRPATPERRFEAATAPERELALYGEADQLLTDREQLPATVFDTTTTRARQLAVEIAELILAQR
jgi:dTMP kinase